MVACRFRLPRLAVYKEIEYRSPALMGHAMPRGTPASRYLGPDEYCFLGDNSVRSKNSRFWGVAPGRSIVGVVRWLYWPPERQHLFP